MTEPDVKPRTETQCYAPSGSSLCFSSPNPSLNISSTELQRVIDSLLDQIDWLEVALKVAKNRAPSVYCNAIKKILLAHIYRLIKVEGKGDGLGKFKNVKDDEERMYVYEGDDEVEDGSGFSRSSEDGGDCVEDGDNGENMQTNEDESQGEYKGD